MHSNRAFKIYLDDPFFRNVRKNKLKLVRKNKLHRPDWSAKFILHRPDWSAKHQGNKYIVETKIWEGPKSYQAGKRQLAKYLKLEGVAEGYYIVFDHRKKPQARIDRDTIEGKTIVSYCIPVRQEKYSTVG